MTPEEQELLLAERDQLRREVASLSEQVKLVVRAEHALTRSRRVVDRQLQRIRRLADFSLSIAGAEAVPDILEQARAALLDFFEVDSVAVVAFSDDSPRESWHMGGPGLAEPSTEEGSRVSSLLAEHSVAFERASSPRLLLWVPLCASNRPVAVLLASTSRTNAHHRDMPGAEHLPFLELFASHVTRALDNAALTGELRRSNQRLQVSLQDLERAQSQLLQAQKLEALGRLAGGIAHDFNNLLTLMVGAAELLRPALVNDLEARENLELIADATKRATGITRRLLAFGRQQGKRRDAVDLNALTTDFSRVLRRLLGQNVTLDLSLARDLSRVLADPVHLEQILLNLVVNARDAMPDGGNLTIETRRARASELPKGLAETGEMVCLRVVDTGVGMDEVTRRRLFEPFFTTKPAGQGTGLGLATVYGLVSQNGGQVGVHSSPGCGAAFEVFLPVAYSAHKLEPLRSKHARGRVLVVDDDDGVRRVAARTLRQAGFVVEEARDGDAALAIFEHHGESLDLVVTDVTMPGVSGPELVRQLRNTSSQLPVLFISGHTFDALDARALDPRHDDFLPKPFTPKQLQETVDHLLERAALGAPQRQLA